MNNGSDDITLKPLPPQNLEAEQMVLGAVLVENGALGEVKDILQPGDFYKTAHGAIYDAMIAMGGRGEAIDLITLVDALRRGSGTLDNIGGASYLASLVSFVPTAANIRHHARIVSAAKQLRDIDRASREAQASVQNGEAPGEIITRMVGKLNDIRRGEGSEIISQRDLILYGYGEVERRYECKGALSGIPTGFRDLDQLLDGLQDEDLIIVGGRPAMGKSAFAETVADNVAGYFKQQAEGDVSRVGYVSIEMGRRQLAVRALSRVSGVPNTRIRRGALADGDWDRLADGCGRAVELPIVYETAAMHDGAVERVIDTMKQRHNCRLVILDYLQLMGSEERIANREQEVSAHSRMLKRKAKQHKLPVIALAQLSRAVENRVDKRPGLADLRESGGLEQDADVVMFLYREEVYKKCECPWNMECLCGRRGKAEVLVRKQRMGPCGDILLRWDGKTTRYLNWEG
jgi:replicative DNA helicase